MELKSFLMILVGLSLCCFLLLLGLGKLIAKREEEQGLSLADRGHPSSRLIRGGLNILFLRSYALFMKLPPLRFYVLKVRFRLSVLQVYDEFSLRRQTIKIVYLILGTLTFVIGVLTAMNPNLIFFLSLLIAAVVIQGLILDGYINRLEKKLLEQMLDLFGAVRLAYHRHGMVEDAIDESIESVGEEIALHAHRIYDALSDVKPDEALEKYYEVAPNRFLRAFAGISRMIMEFGDRKKDKGSLYLRGLASLTGEIQLDLIRRSKLDYLLKGLNLIALVPIFFTKPIEIWARRNFPLMDQFYLSKAGILAKLGIFLIILICYLLLQKLKSEEETDYKAGRNRNPWESALRKWRLVRKCSAWFTPRFKSAAYERIHKLLKDSNHHLSVETLQIRRLVIFLLCVVVTTGTFSYLHLKSRSWILNEPPASYVFFGTMSQDDAEAAAEIVDMDKQVMAETGMDSNREYDQIAASITQVMAERGLQPNDNQLVATAERVIDKLKRWNAEYLKWWELLLSLIAGWIGYCVPVWTLMFQRRMRLMDMRQEVYQFHTMISILKELERISVEEILDWLHSYAVIFKIPLQKCLLHFGHGGEEALRQMKEEAGLDEFRQLADKLLLATEKITISDAFDELESEMAYHFERRRLDYEKSLDTKAGIGRIIGFAPMYCLVFVYLVIPLIWMSFQQMGIYFEQIQHI